MSARPAALSARQRRNEQFSGRAASTILHRGNATTSKPQRSTGGINYSQKNREHIRAVAQSVRQQEQQKREAEMRPKFKMERFMDVEPRVWSDPRVMTPSIAPERRQSGSQGTPSENRSKVVNHGFGALGSHLELQKRIEALQQQQHFLQQELSRRRNESTGSTPTIKTGEFSSHRAEPSETLGGVNDQSLSDEDFVTDQLNAHRETYTNTSSQIQQEPAFRPDQSFDDYYENEQQREDESIYNLHSQNHQYTQAQNYQQDPLDSSFQANSGMSASRMQRKPSLPSREELQAAAYAADLASKPPRKNHIVMNARSAISTSSFNSLNLPVATPRDSQRPSSRQMTQAKSARDYLTPRHAKGEIPQYLLERKAQWAEEEKAQKEAAERAKEPPGMVRLSEEKRLETLSLLRQRHSELLKIAAASPLVVETESRKRRQRELEDQIKQVESMISAMEHQVVYVKP